MTGKREQLSEPLETDLVAALRALDNQVAREMQRSPVEREQHGVQKWEPYAKRIEKVCGFIISAVGEERCGMDGVLILAQAAAKSLRLLVEELGQDNLGEMRGRYSRAAMEAIARDAREALAFLRGDAGEMM